MRAKWVAKEYKTYARPELLASTPPLEALKVVLSEYAAGQDRIGRTWDSELGEGPGDSMQTESAFGCVSNNVLGRRVLGRAKHEKVQHLWTQEASKSEKFVTKKVGTHVKPADLMTKKLYACEPRRFYDEKTA